MIVVDLELFLSVDYDVAVISGVHGFRCFECFVVDAFLGIFLKYFEDRLHTSKLSLRISVFFDMLPLCIFVLQCGHFANFRRIF